MAAGSVSGCDGGSLLRHRTLSRRQWPRFPILLFCVACVVCLVTLIVVNFERHLLAAGFVASVGGAFLLFRAGAGLVMRAANVSVLRAHHLIRLGVANVARPGAPTVSVFVSLGLGLSVLVMVAVTEANVTRQPTRALPRVAPAFYFIDIQASQADLFRKSIDTLSEADIIRMAPVTRGRLTAINDQNIDVQNVDPSVRWAVQGDRGLTVQDHPSANDKIVSGTWWTPEHKDTPLVSVAAHVAKGLGWRWVMLWTFMYWDGLFAPKSQTCVRLIGQPCP